jgi:protein-S-isoprenylcysteine O-methyltransferase Ste14
MNIRASWVSHIGQKIFPFRLYFGLAVAIIALQWLCPKPLFGAPYGLVHTLSLSVIAAGLTLRSWAAGCAGRHTRSDRIEAPSLATGGPYAYVRNPIYLGTVFIGLGMCLLIGDPRSFPFAAGTFAILYLTIIPAEEAFLQKQFGAAYVAYCADVPRIIPRLQRWNNSAKVRFRWRSTVGELRIAVVLAMIYAALLFKQHFDGRWFS